MQLIEKEIHLCVAYVFPETPLHDLSITALKERTEYLRSKTVGYLLNELKVRVGIDDRFGNVLSKFLEMRNTFIHNVDEIPRWSLDSEEGMAVVRNFISELLRLSDIVEGVFVGVTRAWLEENQMEVKVEGIPIDFFDKIDALYEPFVDIFFSRKNNLAMNAPLQRHDFYLCLGGLMEAMKLSTRSFRLRFNK